MKEIVRWPLYAANWKMYKTSSEAEAFMQEFLPLLGDHDNEVVICPAATLLAVVAQAATGSCVVVGAQNMHWQTEGAFTGELSAAMLKDAGASYCIVGHSERRQLFHEQAADVAKKAQAALAAELTPIICLGETLEQRESGQTLQVLHDDLQASLAGIAPTVQVVIAYEPVWAIGTGQVATPQDAEEACAHIRASLREIWGELADAVRILYGGSVKPGNIEALMACPNVDGALVGGASLNAESFAAIANCE